MYTTISQLACMQCERKNMLGEGGERCVCGGLLDVVHDYAMVMNGVRIPAARCGFAATMKAVWSLRRASHRPEDASGVWRYRELVLPGDIDPRRIVTRGEGDTRTYRFRKAAAFAGIEDLAFKHEGENPTGSFKDRGMTVAITCAILRDAKLIACASTGNTSASAASYASAAGLPCVVLLPADKIAGGKLAQSLAYGARTFAVETDFDGCLKLLGQVQDRLGAYVVNSVNPFRLEGQKTIIIEALEERGWSPPDWIVVPGGNLGNTAAFGKALRELFELGFIEKVPRIVTVQAEGANPFARSFRRQWKWFVSHPPETLATAIRIGDPVNYQKARRAIEWTDGGVTDVTDDEILEAKAVLDSDGVGAEPASCATLAAVKNLVLRGMIWPGDSVLAVLTGHFLKDADAVSRYHLGAAPSANPPMRIAPIVEAVLNNLV